VAQQEDIKSDELARVWSEAENADVNAADLDDLAHELNDVFNEPDTANNASKSTVKATHLDRITELLK